MKTITLILLAIPTFLFGQTKSIDAPGEYTFSTAYSFNQESQYTYDTDADGNPNSITKFTYDANGNRTREEYDTDADGNPNSIDKYQYFHKVKCSSLGDGLVHKLQVNIIESGLYSFSLCGSSFQNIMALSGTGFCDSTISFAKDGCGSGDALFQKDLESGTYYLTVAGKGDTDKGDYKLSIQKIGELGTEDVLEDQMVLYPNPAKNTLTIQNPNLTMATQYDIYAVDGKKVLSIHPTKNEIDISSIDAGLYFIKAILKNGSEVMNSKFVKVN